MRIGMLGPFEVRAGDGSPVDVPGARLRALLAALALRPGRAVPKAALVDWIWGEHPPADAANALQRLVSRLRKALPGGAVEGRTDGYLLAVGPDAVDAVRFERLVRAARARTGDVPRRAALLREALGLWRGAALQDIGLQGGAACEAAAVRLEELRLSAAEERFDAEIALGRGAEAVPELTDLVAAHPVRERLVAALMRALVAAGRDSEALLAYQRAREALADALGADPSPDLAALHAALLRGGTGPGRAGAAREEVRSTNLRAELTSFVGKERDVAAVRALTAEHRLTTVVGPGGAGKTRLATETARTLLGELPDGAWLVELAALGADSDVSDVAQAALTGLGLRDTLLGGTPHAEPMERLVAAVRGRDALLVLDNCEHVVGAAALFAHELLGECRRLRILTTSREPLGITGEALWPAEPLALPDEDAAPEEIASSPAVRLLRDRASAVRRDLAADSGTLTTMARVCRALDGMPLAIELAAARLRTLSVDQLAGRLDDRFRLLTGGSRTALPRHRTLRAMVDWSWELLTPPERTVLRRLAAFADSASLEAAEDVCADGTDGAGAGRDGVFEVLSSLVEKSLLVAEGGAAHRYRMTGTIKEYAAQRLTEAGEAERARRAHLDCFTRLVEAADPRLRRAEQVEWLARLEPEHDNIALAMRGALAAGEAQAAMRLAAGAGWYWWLSGHKTEGFELLTAAAGMPGEVTDEARAMVYAFISTFVSSGRRGEREAAEWIHKAHEFSLRSGRDNPLLGLVSALEHLLREPSAFVSAYEPLLGSGDPWVRALARLHLGKMRVLTGHGGREADAYLEQAVGEFRALGERFGISFALTELADRIATRGEFAAAAAHYEQAIAVVTEVGATEDIIRMRSIQAQLHRLLGDADAAAAALAEAQRYAEGVTWPDALYELALARAALARWDGDGEEARRQLGVAIAVLGEDAEQVVNRAALHDAWGYLAEDLGTARAHRAAAVEAAAEAEIPPMTANVLVGVADLALRRDDPAQAARLLAAATDLRGLKDRSHPEAARIELDARRRLGDARFAEAEQEGKGSDWARLAAVTLAF
ncbi:BTAD domain-containing putative transcriptional regulator [Streptomyces albiaxialis]|uniref:BTAD domain-containing putative transcriptional regulator n=1 Tax=Streptomyces albiaxialis TaxID=329523 RepID=A0ABN2VRS9_9ACTN